MPKVRKAQVSIEATPYYASLVVLFYVARTRIQARNKLVNLTRKP